MGSFCARLAGWALSLLFPPRCPFCGAALPHGEWGLPLPCPQCRALPFAQKGDLPGGENRGFAFERCAAPFRYEGAAREAIVRFKFRGRAFAPALAAYMAPAVRAQCAGVSFDFVTAVPLTRREVRRRGFNQSELLGRELARALGAPYCRTLRKPRDIPPQHTLRAPERRRNVRGAFEARAPLRGGTALLVDDVATTGATLEECAQALRRAGAARVLCAVAAVVPRPGAESCEKLHEEPPTISGKDGTISNDSRQI